MNTTSSATKKQPTFLKANGSYDTKINEPDAEYEGITWQGIAQLIQQPQNKPKLEASFIIPSTYKAHDGRSHEAQRINGEYHMLAIDVDDGNPDASAVIGSVESILGDVTMLIYSSSGATADNKKWRVLIPLAQPIDGDTYSECQLAFFALLEKEGVQPDYVLSRTGQVIYLPNVPPDKLDDAGKPLFYESQIIRGNRFDATGDNAITRKAMHDKAERERIEQQVAQEREKRRIERERKLAENPNQISPIDEFNARHTVEDLLLRYGYDRLGSSAQWRSRYQSTKSYATKNFGDYWVSLSGSDVSAGVGSQKGNDKAAYCWGDAFALFCHYDHNDDVEAAVRAYGGEIQAQSLGAKPKVDNDFQPVQQTPDAPAPVEADQETPNFVMDHKGRIPLNHHNTREIFRTHEDWKGVLAFDEFAQRKMLLKKVPLTAGNPNHFRPREIRDDDYIDIISWFNSNGFPNASKNTVIDCADKACMENIISPVKHWLESLTVENEDDDLLDRWAFKYLDIQTDDADEIEYIRQVTSKWLISAVARGINAGCKADAVLILEGSQGAGKSTALRLLCGDDWFGDALPPMHTKDASDYVRGKWIVELAELSNVNKAEVEIVKAFVSRSEERFRPAYGRSEITYPRHCVFAGTTNKSDYLRDETGNRRFWPIKVGPKIDTKGIREAREQIWAHAVMAYKNGEQWWLDGYADQLARNEQDKRLATDEWLGRIETYCEGKASVSITQVATEALEMEVKAIGRAEQNRITAILATLQYERDGKFSTGDRRNQARFTRKVENNEDD